MHDPDAHDEMIDRIIDDAQYDDVLSDDMRAEVELQRLIDQSLQALFEPGAAPDMDALRVDVAVDDAIDAGRAPAPTGELADDIRLQAAVDEGLRRQFGQDAPSIPLRRPRRVALYAAAAAVLMLVSAAIVLVAMQPRESELSVLYHAHVDSGFIQFPCETPDAFQAWCEDNFEHSMRPFPGDEPLTFLGWNYDAPISRYTGVMIGMARGEHVLVLVDELEHDIELGDPGEGLNLFRTTIGGLVLYELTPLDEPVFTPTFRLVD